MKTKLHIRIGGVMRCCLATLQQADVEDKEGEVLPCKYCHSSLIVRDGAWEWNQEAENDAE